MASSTYHSYPCPLWDRGFDPLLQHASINNSKYCFINRSSFELPAPLRGPMDEDPLLIRHEYEKLYDLISGGIGFACSGFAVIGHPGIGQLQLHCLA